ncbi:MAG: type II restriction endonuclease [Terrisporobacter othiniensis]|uniref:type II restriction endonuclease n=1 Tax=Terrisporobacter othiniensis TaxID=1577792 RepID=UPI002906A5AC|nr:type II restriction endonuclease [Terrisporobacter othiniensis]MDU6985301.1 type II restriction endonuclease [Terrisporobacter othiniensis]
MKRINYYNIKKLETNDEVFDYLIDHLIESIYTWDYFTQFDKCMKNAESLKKELDLLNDLLGISEEEIEDKLISIINSNANVKKALLLLVALRPVKLKETAVINDFETLTSSNKFELFTKKGILNKEDERDILYFFKETGLEKFFVNKEVSNLLDYCKGVEVGLDTNARKNRSGQTMESICEKFVEEFCEKQNFKYIAQATSKRIKEEFNIELKMDKMERRIDYAIKTDNNLYLIEVNYYSGGGSKLKATAGEYKELSDFIKAQGYEFIWITDGKGWNTAKAPLKETFEHDDYIFNLNMIKDGVLEEIVK